MNDNDKQKMEQPKGSPEPTTQDNVANPPQAKQDYVGPVGSAAGNPPKVSVAGESVKSMPEAN